MARFLLCHLHPLYIPIVWLLHNPLSWHPPDFICVSPELTSKQSLSHTTFCEDLVGPALSRTSFLVVWESTWSWCVTVIFALRLSLNGSTLLWSEVLLALCLEIGIDIEGAIPHLQKPMEFCNIVKKARSSPLIFFLNWCRRDLSSSLHRGGHMHCRSRKKGLHEASKSRMEFVITGRQCPV